MFRTFDSLRFEGKSDTILKTETAAHRLRLTKVSQVQVKYKKIRR